MLDDRVDDDRGDEEEEEMQDSEHSEPSEPSVYGERVTVPDENQGGDDVVVVEEEQRSKKKRFRPLQHMTWQNGVFVFELKWLAYDYCGALWFAEKYSIPGVVEQRHGRTLCQIYGAKKEHEYYMKLIDKNGQVLYGSYKSNAEFLDSFSAKGQLGHAEPLIALPVNLRVKGPYADGDNVRSAVFQLGGANELVATLPHLVVTQLRTNAGNKKICVEQQGKNLPDVLDNLAQPPDEPFDFNHIALAEEFCPPNSPCRLNVTIHNVAPADVQLMCEEFNHFLSAIFTWGLKWYGLFQNSVDEAKPFNGALLEHSYSESAKSLLFVYNEPKLYFANVADLVKFWKFSFWHRVKHDGHFSVVETALIGMRYRAGDVFVREFIIDNKSLLDPRNEVPIPSEENPATLYPSPLSVSVVDKTFEAANVSGLPPKDYIYEGRRIPSEIRMEDVSLGTMFFSSFFVSLFLCFSLFFFILRFFVFRFSLFFVSVFLHSFFFVSFILRFSSFFVFLRSSFFCFSSFVVRVSFILPRAYCRRDQGCGFEGTSGSGLSSVCDHGNVQPNSIEESHSF